MGWLWGARKRGIRWRQIGNAHGKALQHIGGTVCRAMHSIQESLSPFCPAASTNRPYFGRFTTMEEERGTGRTTTADSRILLTLGCRDWRRGSGSNRRIKVLQTSPLPLGYRALTSKMNHESRLLAWKGWQRHAAGAGDGGRTRDFDLGKVALYH